MEAAVASTSWHSYPSVWALGHRALGSLFDGPVVVQEKVDGCVGLDTPILKDDLTWVPARELKVGDGLVGLVYERDRLRLKHSIVTAAMPIVKPCVRVTTDKTIIVASKDHPFWTRKTSSNNPSRWIEAAKLKAGSAIPYIPVWETDHTWEAGCWDAGAINGLAKATVLAVEDVGEQSVMGLSTSTETYWAGGLASHNSQFSFGVFDGELKCRSKGAVLNLFAPEGMFVKAVETARKLADAGLLRDGWTYRGEYLQKPKHNALAYDRVPQDHIIVFDISTGHEEYLLLYELEQEAHRIGLEVVPALDFGVIDNPLVVRAFLDRESVLGGQKIEGVVIKNYSQFGPDKKVLMGKFVSEAFKEVHSKTWGEANPKQGDIVQRLISTYATPARWDKAILHLRERGELEDSPRDIGKLIAEIQADVEKECRDEIADAFYSWGWPHVRRALTSGFPEHYKEVLLRRQLEEEVA